MPPFARFSLGKNPADLKDVVCLRVEIRECLVWRFSPICFLPLPLQSWAISDVPQLVAFSVPDSLRSLTGAGFDTPSHLHVCVLGVDISRSLDILSHIISFPLNPRAFFDVPQLFYRSQDPWDPTQMPVQLDTPRHLRANILPFEISWI